MEVKRETKLRPTMRASAALGLVASLQRIMPSYAFENAGLKAGGVGEAEANGIDLLIREQQLQFGKRRGPSITIKGTVPGLLKRLREGSDAILRVTNELNEGTSMMI